MPADQQSRILNSFAKKDLFEVIHISLSEVSEMQVYILLFLKKNKVLLVTSHLLLTFETNPLDIWQEIPKLEVWREEMIKVLLHML